MKVMIVQATIGSRELYEDGRVRYVSAPTEDGRCYKDVEAWNTRGICYIPEVDFTGHECTLERPGLGYTREDVEELVRETLKEFELPFSDEFVSRKARCVLGVAQWESIGVIVDRIDWEEELNEYNMQEG